MFPSTEEGPSSSDNKAQARVVEPMLGKRKLPKDSVSTIQPTSSLQERTVPIDTAAILDFDMSNDGRKRKHDPDLDSPIFPAGVDKPKWFKSEVRHPWCIDGVSERRGHVKPPVAAIFIHAGAGYHSTANERFHLDACSEAARVAMKFLKAGASAVDGVEAALKILEDSEITNAGFGSNLAIDGTVECDATIVDHFGRSGACGATPNIKNPISLAKVILRESHKALSLRRVPPNLLVGKGAKDFATEHGIPLVHNNWLVSRNAQDRYDRWRKDLKLAEEAKGFPSPKPDAHSPTPLFTQKGRDKRDHTNAITTGTWNEGQPDSPAPTTPADDGPTVPSGASRKSGSPQQSTPTSPRVSARLPADRSPLSFLGAFTTPKGSGIAPPSEASLVGKEQRKIGHPINNNGETRADMGTGDRASSPSPPPWTDLDTGGAHAATGYHGDEDMITDTVGAIAIDQWGNMAAGSSSGGIGMKHRGRMGPAALVGIGTAVIPGFVRQSSKDRDTNEHDDKEKVEWQAVSVVTSGTGEHMAITQASQKCAERLYHSTKRGPGGQDLPEDDEAAIMESFIVNDFQNHPGVLRSPSASAIGAMAVKQTDRGHYLYFAHNTDSFALASMSSDDLQPHCVMSRLDEGSVGVAQGARKIAQN